MVRDQSFIDGFRVTRHDRLIIGEKAVASDIDSDKLSADRFRKFFVSVILAKDKSSSGKQIVLFELRTHLIDSMAVAVFRTLFNNERQVTAQRGSAGTLALTTSSNQTSRPKR